MIMHYIHKSTIDIDTDIRSCKARIQNDLQVDNTEQKVIESSYVVKMFCIAQETGGAVLSSVRQRSKVKVAKPKLWSDAL